MKLVIDISKKDYEFIKDLQYCSSGRRSGKRIEYNIVNAIKNGVPLPTKTKKRKTIGEVIESMDEDQRKVLCYLVEKLGLSSVTVEARPHEKWISVKDKLPKDEERVLIYADVDNEEDRIAIAYRMLEEWSDDEYIWRARETLGHSTDYDDEIVIAWMPLPEPYEEEE